jgi:hypothetical protein
MLLLLVALAAVTFESVDLLSPPFSDAELEANQVDTWDAYVLGSLATLVLLLIGLGLSALGVWLNKGGRIAFIAASVAFAAALGVTIVNVELLTQRVERLVGHDLRWI